MTIGPWVGRAASLRATVARQEPSRPDVTVMVLIDTPSSADAPATDRPPELTDRVRASLAHCHKVAKRARNFYYGMKLTPEPKRSALYAIYAFMRACDDLADDAAESEHPQLGRDRIEAFRRQMVDVLDRGGDGDGAKLPDGPMWPAFLYVMRRYPIDPAHLHAMLDGQVADLFKKNYTSFDELYGYCYNVASTVGLTCVAIWGDNGEHGVAKLAEYRGIALQLTNILRDVAEDTQRGRCYLPAEDLCRFELSPMIFKNGGVFAEKAPGVRSDGDPAAGSGAGEAYDRFMRFQIERARGYYEMSRTLEQHLDPACRPTCWAMMRIYEGLLDRIANNPRRVLAGRTSLSGYQKAGIALRATWRRTWA